LPAVAPLFAAMVLSAAGVVVLAVIEFASAVLLAAAVGLVTFEHPLSAIAALATPIAAVNLIM